MTFTAYVWTKSPHKVTAKRHFKTLKGAQRFGDRTVAKHDNVERVSIRDEDDLVVDTRRRQ